MLRAMLFWEGDMAELYGEDDSICQANGNAEKGYWGEGVCEK